MKIRKILGILAISMLLTACKTTEEIDKTESYEIQNEVSFIGAGFQSIAKGKDMELLLDAKTGTLRWQNCNTGEYVDNRLSKDEISNTTALSDVVASYFSGSHSKKYNTTTQMDSYSYGIESESLRYEEIENGVRFFYRLGSDKISYKQFPIYISDERMQNLVLQYCDKKQTKAVKAQYRQMSSGVWARKASKESPLTGLAAPQLYNIFYEVGAYNMDELIVDSTEWNNLDELPDTQAIEIVMDYYLDGDDLMVRIPAKHLISGKDYPIEYIEVLPYFMSSKSKDGYIFVPDGSGALIYLDNDRLTEYQFQGRYFGGDILQNMNTYQSATPYMALPVYGIKSDNHAILGIIEEGAEIAQLNTYISGYYSGIDYARASLRFYIREAQTLSNYVGATNNYILSKASTDYYVGDIVLRYCFLTDDEANYTGMAKAYQNRLLMQDCLNENMAEEEAPLFLEILGEIDKKKYFAGIPYDSSIALTSFDEAKNILADLSEEKISNIKLCYEGMLNGGINQRAVEKVSISSRLGGKSKFNELNSYAKSIGAEIYPNVLLETAYTDKNLSKEERSYTLIGQLAKIEQFNLVTNIPVEGGEDSCQYMDTFVISPNYIANYTSKFAKSYDKLEIGNIASSDFMTFMSADYRNGNNVSITTGSENYYQALETVSNNNSLLLSNPMVTAYPYADYLMNIPMDNSKLKIFDACVPFTQMVLEGCIPYAGDYVNRENESIEETLMKSLEAKSALNFRLMAADTADLRKTTKNDVFFAEYRLWKDKIAPCYQKFNDFYKQVKDAYIVSHEIVDKDNDVRVVTYSNGVKLYLNYGDEDAVIEGVNVAPLSYVIRKGGKS